METLFSCNVFLHHVLCTILILFAGSNVIVAQKYLQQAYPGYAGDGDSPYRPVQAALAKLKESPQWSPDWPDPGVKLGQVSGVALDPDGNLLVFHRGPNTWDYDTFNERNVYQAIGEPPIAAPTVLVFNSSGDLVDSWGENMFHMPHGIASDAAGGVWLTDVALHQVFHFARGERRRPQLVLGQKFEPGDDEAHFCKPSAVAVTAGGDFFVADGYCNARVVKYAADGTRLLQWGRHDGSSPFSFKIPHALTLAEDRGLVCVADRERGRAACFRADNGSYVDAFSHWLIGPRVFSVAYAPVDNGRLYIVNGPGGGVPVRGYVIDFTSGRLTGTFAPPAGLASPHDVVAAPDGSAVYVAELNPYRVHRFTEEPVHNESAAPPPPPPVKPTVYVGRKGGGARRWERAGGEFRLRRLLARDRFVRVRSDDSDDEPSPMLRAPPATA